MSATYLLAHLSPAASEVEQVRPGTPNEREQGHNEAVWCCSWTTLPNGQGIVVTAGADACIKLWDPTNGAIPIRTMRPVGLGLVGLSVDPSPTGATFLVVSSIDSVLTRWSFDGELEGTKTLGPGALAQHL